MLLMSQLWQPEMSLDIAECTLGTKITSVENHGYSSENPRDCEGNRIYDVPSFVFATT